MYNLKLLIAILIFILSSCSQTFQKNGLSEKKIENFDIKIGKISKKFLIDNYGPSIFENVFNNITTLFNHIIGVKFVFFLKFCFLFLIPFFRFFFENF